MRFLGKRTKRVGGQEPTDWAALHRLDETDRLDAYRTHCSWPALYYESTAWILKIAGTRRLVEVGVAYGYHAQYLMREIPELEYVGIDPYLPGYDPSDLFPQDVARLFACPPSEAMNRLHDAVVATLNERHGERSRLIRSSSIEAARQFADSSLDAVFIDGNHAADAVSGEIAAWFPKLKHGGLLLGDDYQWPSVRAAWTEAFEGPVGKDVQLIENRMSGYRTVVARKE